MEEEKPLLAKLHEELSIFYWGVFICSVELQVVGSVLIRKQLMIPEELGRITMVTENDPFLKCKAYCEWNLKRLFQESFLFIFVLDIR